MRGGGDREIGDQKLMVYSHAQNTSIRLQQLFVEIISIFKVIQGF